MSLMSSTASAEQCAGRTAGARLINAVFEVDFWTESNRAFSQYEAIARNLTGAVETPIRVLFKTHESTGEFEESQFPLPEGQQLIQRTERPGKPIQVEVPQKVSNYAALSKSDPFLGQLIGTVIGRSQDHMEILRDENDLLSRLDPDSPYLQLLEGEAIVTGLRADDHSWRSRVLHSFDSESGGSLSSAWADFSIIQVAARDIQVYTMDPADYDRDLHFYIVHTHPGSGAPLNQYDLDAAEDAFSTLREVFPRAKIHVHILAISNREAGNLIFHQSIRSSLPAYTIR